MNQTPRCAYMLLMVHAMMCLSISNGYMRPRLSLHPVPTRPSHPYRARYSREKATPADVQGTKNENGNRDQTENDENGSNLCVLLLLCALCTSLRRLPNVPKALLTPPFGWLPPICQTTPKHQVQKSHPFSQDRPVSKCRLSLPGPNLPMHFSSFPPCPSPVEQ